MISLKEKWDLESIFPGERGSHIFLDFVKKLEEDMIDVQTRVQKMDNKSENHSLLIDSLRDVQDLMLRSKHAFSFTYCLTAQDVNDQEAKILHARSKQNETNIQILIFQLAEKISEIPPVLWQELVSNPEIKSIRFPLEELRKQVTERLAASQEELINDFAIEGYHSCMSLYTTLIRGMRIPFEHEGKQELFTVERLERVFSSTNRQERERAFNKYFVAFKENEEVFSNILNNLAGYRLKIYKHRGWNSVLKESLGLNRMSEQTLEAMWEAVAGSREKFSRYFKRKAELLGINKMSWFDLQTSISETSSVLSFTEGVNFILQQFQAFSPQMADFAVKAFKENWVETVNCPQKSSVGFHTGFPLIKQSRIFKTYYGTAQNIAALAHELGHGYHHYLISEKPPLAQKYGLNLAETASILSELLILNGFVEAETHRSERIALLDLKINISAEYFFNVYTCYLFEEKFYVERKKGPVSPQRLNELMVEVQKAAYGDNFETYHPYFWATKFHLYITRSSFFNYPYTFGFLFSSGIYAKALEEGERFEIKYENLLRESASMTVEELAAKHMGVDLRESEFWENAVKLVMSDIDQFLELTEKNE